MNPRRSFFICVASIVSFTLTARCDDLAAPSPLRTRVFKTDTNAFYHFLKKSYPACFQDEHPSRVVATRWWTTTPQEEVNFDSAPAVSCDFSPKAQYMYHAELDSHPACLNDAMKPWLRSTGVTNSSDKTCFYNDRNGILMIRATAADLQAIQRSLTENRLQSTNLMAVPAPRP